ncbi:MAG: hypothetical protein R3C03_07335 [Pirellulaceae bacterium]
MFNLENIRQFIARFAFETHPIEKDTVIFGILMGILGLAFFSNQKRKEKLSKSWMVFLVVWVIATAALAFVVPGEATSSSPEWMARIWFYLIPLGWLTLFVASRRCTGSFRCC